jgi:hypothetical protein
MLLSVLIDFDKHLIFDLQHSGGCPMGGYYSRRMVLPQQGLPWHDGALA